MAVEIIKAKMYQRRDTTANWLKYNPVLASGEFGYDTNEKKYKIGDGISHWIDLDFAYMGVITNENGNILRYKKVATEEYVNEHISDNVLFYPTISAFPSIGNTNMLYIDLDGNKIYTWDNVNLEYSPIGSDITLPDEQLIPLINDAVDAVLVDRLTIDVPPIVESVIQTSTLYGGDSTTEEEEITE